MTHRQRHRARALARGAAWWIVLSVACKAPVVGPRIESGQSSIGPAVEITGASVDAGDVVAALRITNGGVPVSTRDDAAALAPTFTLAALSHHPVDGLGAWESLLATGRQTARWLPPAGPGTPSGQVREYVVQPGSESGGTLEGSEGAFTYRFETPLPDGFDATRTLRIGVWLPGVGTAEATSTFDFRPDGGAAAPRDTITDANCERCHARVKAAHAGVGVKLCVTCHTWQSSDPDTVDPAAASTATNETNPNPLELGRLIHRIHRGRNLPTLYTSSSTDAAPGLGQSTPFPLPFLPGRNAAAVDRKYAVVGEESREAVFGQVVSRIENAQPARTIAEGVAFPRDLRDCDVCHEGAPQESEVIFGISRRTCQGCHPDVWFFDMSSTPISDAVHFAHAGGPQADDAQCGGCHVAATIEQPTVYAPIADIHVPPYLSPRENTPAAEIVAVRGLRPGAAPTIVFKITDQVGPVVPTLGAPDPANDTRAGGTPLSRAFQSVRILIDGPTAPDYLGLPSSQVTSSAAGNPSMSTLTADPTTNEYTYTFASTLPEGAQGTWTVALEGSRRSSVSTDLHNAAADEFLWPYTGETLVEAFTNAFVDVDTATGEWTAASPGTVVPRRTVVTQERCERCHGHFSIHGGPRNRLEHCIACHTATATDWARRPTIGGSGTNVDLAATLDGIEERSVHFKVLIHRMHTGGRRGAASLEGIEPHVVYGYGSTPYFFDEGVFPNDLANCTVCHEGKSYLIESIPADAPPTIANETPTIRHQATSAHVAGERAVPPIQAACLGCHASGASQDHARRNTVDGAERCARCHARGAYSVEVAHGLAPAEAAAVSATWSSIAREILVPRCASAACHGGVPPAYFPNLDAETGRATLVDQPSQQAPMALVVPSAPEESYLLIKIRGEGASVGGIGTPMPIQDAALTPSELAAIEAWIANGAPND